MTNKTIQIPLSKRKMLLTLLGAGLFIIAGIYFVVKPNQLLTGFITSTIPIVLAGVASILFFGAIFIISIRKLYDKMPGLIISADGITDNASGTSAGFIPWADINEIKTAQVMSQKFLLIMVRNPEEHLAKISNAIKRKGMALNLKSTGTPISISANSLQIDFEELHMLLQQHFSNYKVQALP